MNDIEKVLATLPARLQGAFINAAEASGLTSASELRDLGRLLTLTDGDTERAALLVWESLDWYEADDLALELGEVVEWYETAENTREVRRPTWATLPRLYGFCGGDLSSVYMGLRRRTIYMY